MLVDQLTAYDHSTDPLYFTMRFIDGFKFDIKPIVLVQRPKYLDTAYSLALLQEDVSTPSHPSTRKHEQGSFQRFPPRAPLPLPPPPRIDKQPTPVLPEEKRLCEGKSLEDKWAALKTYRRAKGLCIKCVEKWSREHRCAPSVQLHALQEILQLFNIEDEEDIVSVSSKSQLFLALSAHAVNGTEGPKTRRMQGQLQGVQITILVDSGSSHTFISEKLAQQCAGIAPLSTPIGVQVANGSKLTCTSYIPQGMWNMG
jgi:hypothetical protein